jgi:hypothetical protein
MTAFTLARKLLIESGALLAILASSGKHQDNIFCVAAPVYWLHLQPVPNTDSLAYVRLAGKKALDEHSAYDQSYDDDSDVDSLLNSFGNPFTIDTSHILPLI